ncbi:MAG: hypothetical protein CMO01_26525 [Thalassobius sp.]|nr:hypothetical protein [Thalassovita sp.]
MQKITPFLWFDGNAEEAMEFYASIFKESKIISKNRLGEGQPLFLGSFKIENQEFMVLNGGPHFTFSPAISFFVNCNSQKEVDKLWEQLSAGGTKERCGWLKDKFGISWQIIPTALGKLMNDKDPEKVNRVRNAMLQMTKIEIVELQKAYEGL